MPKFTNLLRRNQVEALKADLKGYEKVANDPRAMASIQDRAEFLRQYNSTKKMLETQAPTPLPENQRDAAAKRVAELKDELVVGMPTSQEMRKNPPGTVNKHMQWEKRNIDKLDEWKHLVARLNHDSEDPDLTNFEKHRPQGGAQEASMFGAQIPGKQFYLPAATPEPGALATDTELAALRQANPALADALGTLTGEQRATVLDAVRKALATPVEKPRKKRTLTGEQRKAIGERLAAARAAKHAVAA